MTSTSQSTGHSAQVRMELHLHGHIHRVGQLGPGFLILRPPVDLAPGEGEVLLRIDGKETRHPVRLEQGSSSEQVVTTITTPLQKVASISIA